MDLIKDFAGVSLYDDGNGASQLLKFANTSNCVCANCKMSGISIFADSQKNCTAYNPTDPANGQKDIYVQLVLSLALGVSAFLGFCVSILGDLCDQTTDHHSFCAHDGKAYTPHAKDRIAMLMHSPNFLILSSDGCPCCIG
jgi:hypothetical protein